MIQGGGLLLALGVVAGCGLAAPDAARAQSRLTLPEGCTAYASVQRRNCVVSHLFTCAGDPEGYQRRQDFDEEGVSYIGLIDYETRWLESEHVRAGASDRLEPGAQDPASFSELIGTGRDDWHFQMRTLPDIMTEYEGYDRLTGNTIEIDGVLLEETEFVAVARIPGGAELWRQTGNEYINREWRTFLSGTRTTYLPNETFDTDGSPVGIDLPGDPGFLTRTPREGCGALMSQADPTALPPAAFLRTAFTGD